MSTSRWPRGVQAPHSSGASPWRASEAPPAAAPAGTPAGVLLLFWNVAAIRAAERKFDKRRRRHPAVQTETKRPDFDAAAKGATGVNIDFVLCGLQGIWVVWDVAGAGDGLHSRCGESGAFVHFLSPSSFHFAPSWIMYVFVFSLRFVQLQGFILVSMTLFFHFIVFLSGGGRGWRWCVQFSKDPEMAQKNKSAKRSLEVSHKLVLILLLNNQLEQRSFAACFPN